jgi:hypothetical protein
MLFGETVAIYCENHTEHTDTVRTPQETHDVTATETSRLMLFGETVAIYCENQTEHIKAGGKPADEYSTHCAVLRLTQQKLLNISHHHEAYSK